MQAGRRSTWADAVLDAVADQPIRGVPIVVALVGAAWIVPPLAIVTVWPTLFFVPGWAITRRFVPGLGLPGRLGLSIVGSVVVSAHVTNLAAVAVGRFDREVALMAAAGLGLLVLALVRRGGTRAVIEERSVHERPAAGSGERSALAVAALAAGVVSTVLAASVWRRVGDDWISGGWNWSDFLVHVSIGASIGAGNFPPQVPYAAGAPLSYHWFADFHGAISATVAGIDLIPVYVASNAVMAGAFALLVWELASRLFGDRRAVLPATLLAMFGGGLGWIRLPIDAVTRTADLATLVSTTAYDNTWAGDWPLFRIASVLGTGFLTHRATAFGLPILVAIVLLAHHGIGRRPTALFVAGCLAALLAPFHFYFLPAAYLLVALMAAGRRAWRESTWRRDALLFLAPAIAAVPFILGPVLLQQARGSFRIVAGWGEAPFELGPAAVVFFYVTNLGLPAVLAAAALTRPGPLPARAFLGLWAVALFLVPNLVVVGAVEFDMNKYFQAMWVAVALLAGWLMRTWRGPAIAAVVLVSALSPALVSVWHMTSETVALTGPAERAARWIAASTPPRSVFVTEAWINNPVDLAGRLRITSFGPYVANLGIDADARAADVRRAFCDGDRAAIEVMDTYAARYVLSPGGLLECDDGQPTDFSASPLFTTVYSVEGVTVWDRRDPGG